MAANIVSTEYGTGLPWSQSLPAGGLLAVTLVALAVLSYSLLSLRRRPPLPPGPKGHPIFGMTFRSPTVRPWLKYTQWARKYGPLVHYQVGLKHYIVVSSGYVSRTLLDDRHKIYSGRPPSQVGDLLTRGLRSVLMPYGDELKRVRRMYNKIISSRKCDAYNEILQAEAVATLQYLIDEPDRFFENINRYALSVARTIAFNQRVPHADDEIAKEIKKLGDNFSGAMLPGKYLFEKLPILQLLPRSLRPWMDELETLRGWEEDFLIREYRRALESAELHPEDPSVARDVEAERQATGGFTELAAAHNCMEILSTGSETTSASIKALIQGCIAYPEVVKKAHEELDRVVGQGRYPSWQEDEPKLPYIRAMIKEQHRWRTVSPLGFPHTAAEEDIYNGYRIPKGSTVLINSWGMQMDPERYPDPEKYYPERFLEHSLSASAYANSSDVDARDHFAYGNGRRICPGIHLAERSIFNLASHILHTFNILPALNHDGKEIPVDTSAYSNSLICAAEPFKARFEVRSEEIGRTLRREWDAKYVAKHAEN